MTNRRYVWVWNVILPMSAVSVTLALSMMAGCMVTAQAQTATPEEAGASSWRASDETRGISIPVDRLGFDHTLFVHGSKNGVLYDGDTVTAGDRIHMSVRTSEDAYLYLAFCAHQKLAIYPQGGIRTRVGKPMIVPQGGAELVIDSNPEPEVLYVILSRTELSVADPSLAQALATRSPGGAPTDCGTSLDAKLAKLSSKSSATMPRTPGSTNVLRGTRVPPKPLPRTHVARGGRSSSDSTKASRPGSGSSGAKHGPTITGAASPNNPPPEPGFERNPGSIIWYQTAGATGPLDVVAADDDGIAVVRYAFTHVTTAPLPPSTSTRSQAE